MLGPGSSKVLQRLRAPGSSVFACSSPMYLAQPQRFSSELFD